MYKTLKTAVLFPVWSEILPLPTGVAHGHAAGRCEGHVGTGRDHQEKGLFFSPNVL